MNFTEERQRAAREARRRAREARRRNGGSSSDSSSSDDEDDEDTPLAIEAPPLTEDDKGRSRSKTRASSEKVAESAKD